MPAARSQQHRAVRRQGSSPEEHLHGPNERVSAFSGADHDFPGAGDGTSPDVREHQSHGCRPERPDLRE